LIFRGLRRQGVKTPLIFGVLIETVKPDNFGQIKL